MPSDYDNWNKEGCSQESAVEIRPLLSFTEENKSGCPLIVEVVEATHPEGLHVICTDSGETSTTNSLAVVRDNWRA